MPPEGPGERLLRVIGNAVLDYQRETAQTVEAIDLRRSSWQTLGQETTFVVEIRSSVDDYRRGVGKSVAHTLPPPVFSDGFCIAYLSTGKRCPHVARPGSSFCNCHQSMTREEGDA